MFWKDVRLKSYAGIKNASSLPQVWHSNNCVMGAEIRLATHSHESTITFISLTRTEKYYVFPQVTSLLIFPILFIFRELSTEKKKKLKCL